MFSIVEDERCGLHSDKEIHFASMVGNASTQREIVLPSSWSEYKRSQFPRKTECPRKYRFFVLFRFLSVDV